MTGHVSVAGARDTLAQVIKSVNPFAHTSASAVSYDYDLVSELFCPPSSFDEVTNGSHHFVIGSIGTGKTIVLKALSIATLGTPDAKGRRLAGIYVPVPAFRPASLDSESPQHKRDAFTHYFILYTIAAVYQQLTDSESRNLIPAFDELVKTLVGVTSLAPTLSGAAPFSREPLGGQMRALLEQLDQYPPPETFDYGSRRRLGLADLAELTTGLSHLIRAATGAKLALLIDGYDQFGYLTAVINALMKQEYAQYFAVVAGCVHFGQFVSQTANGRTLNVDRDCPPIVLDDDYRESASLLDLVAQRFIARAWDGLFPPSTLAQLNASAILGRSRRSDEYAGFECFAELCGGNIRWFLKLCKNAFDHVELVDGSPRIPPSAQHKAAKQVSSESYDLEIQARGKTESVEIQKLCRFVGHKLRNPESKRHASVQSPIELPPEAQLTADVRAAQVIRRAIRHRFLLCDRRERVLVEMNADYIPPTVRMAGILAPRFGVAWR